MALAIALLTASIVAADVFPIPGVRHEPSGPGWRLLSKVNDSTDMAYRVRAATDPAGFAALWRDLTADDPMRRDFTNVPPWLAANFEREIIVLFGVGISSCTVDVQLDDVVIDRSSRLVYSVTTEHHTCGYLDLTGAAVFVVALDRGALPPSPFTVQLHAEPTCRSCQEPEDRLTL